MAGPDLSTITVLADFGFIVTALAGVYASLVVVAIAWKGARMILDAVEGRRERDFDAQEWERDNYIREQEERWVDKMNGRATAKYLAECRRNEQR